MTNCAARTYPLKLLETVYGAIVDGMVASTVRCRRDQNRGWCWVKEWYASTKERVVW